MKKVLTIVLSAISFGLIAGLVMIGINFAARDLNFLQPTVTTTTEAPANSPNTNQNSDNVVPQTILQTVTEDDAIIKLVENAMPSVVAVTNVQKYIQNGYSIFGFRQQAREYEVPASGSGVIVGITDDEVIIVTNNHVVESSSSLSVTFQDGGEAIEAAIKGKDTDKDLAIIAVSKSKIKDDIIKNLKSIKLADSDKIKVGEKVVAIGNALGIGQSVTTGIVSAKDRSIDNINDGEKLIQTDAAINPGNSGGALLNMNGELIGINVAKSSGNAIEGMGYAIPINTAKDVIDTLSNKKTREKIPEAEQGFLGITARNIDSQTATSLGMPEGIYVFKISEDGGASKSDMKEKDIIVSADDQNVKTLNDLQDILRYTRSGQSIKIKVKRLEKGEYVDKEFEVTLGTKPKEEVATKSQAESDNSMPRNNYDPFGDFDDFFSPFRFGW